jgi:hypothetical protein
LLTENASTGSISDVGCHAITTLPTEITGYDQLITVLRQRVVELNTTFDCINQIAGLTDRYLAQLLRPKAAKSIGPVSLFPILGALGLKLQLVPDADATAKLKRRSDWRAIKRNGPRYRRHIRRKK